MYCLFKKQIKMTFNHFKLFYKRILEVSRNLQKVQRTRLKWQNKERPASHIQSAAAHSWRASQATTSHSRAPMLARYHLTSTGFVIEICTNTHTFTHMKYGHPLYSPRIVPRPQVPLVKWCSICTSPTHSPNTFSHSRSLSIPSAV